MQTDFDDIIEKQGWNEETILIHALDFIRRIGQNDFFEEYLELCAEEENRETAIIEKD